MSFQLNSKKYLITYSQVENVDAFTAIPRAHYDFLRSVEDDIEAYRLCKETHQDGGIHFHCYIHWKKAPRRRGTDLLDFGGVHPNIKGIRRTPHKAWDYLGKEDCEIYSTGERPPEPSGSGNEKAELFAEALTQQDGKSFLEFISKNSPRDYCIHFTQLERVAEYHFRSELPEYRSPTFDFHGGDDFTRWYDQARLGDNGGHRRRSLILWGPTRTGKTVWARSLGR